MFNCCQHGETRCNNVESAALATVAFQAGIASITVQLGETRSKLVGHRFQSKVVVVKFLLTLVARLAELALVVIFKSFFKEMSPAREGNLHVRDGGV